MSIKSTTQLTREEAVNKYINSIIYEQKKFLTIHAENMSNEELENKLEQFDEDDGDEFTNYLIVEKVK